MSKSPQTQQAAMLEPMRLEYFEDPSLPAPVLLLYGEKGIDPDEVTVLRRRVRQLADGAAENRFQVDGLAGCFGVEGCSLVAEVTESSSGVELIAGRDRSFGCRLDRAGWQRVWALLEPFVDPEEASSQNGFQYLDESGPIEWIISRSRGW